MAGKIRHHPKPHQTKAHDCHRRRSLGLGTRNPMPRNRKHPRPLLEWPLTRSQTIQTGYQHRVQKMFGRGQSL